MEYTNSDIFSIIVITYNSADYILETLESIRAQEYVNIELIISDDGSSDNTILICENWCMEFSFRFLRVQIVKSDRNTGIPANCNRGAKEANGKWLKFIAGDDLLLPDCISKFYSYILRNSEARVIATNVVKFKGDLQFREVTKYEHSPFNHSSCTAIEQYKYLLRFNRVFAPSVLINKKIFWENGGFNEKYLRLEDYPFWLKLTKSGEKIWFLNDALVMYRQHTGSISQRNLNKFLVHPSRIIVHQFQRDFIIHALPFWESLGLIYQILGERLIFSLGNNSDSYFQRIIQNFFYYSNPLRIIRRITSFMGFNNKNLKYIKDEI